MLETGEIQESLPYQQIADLGQISDESSPPVFTETQRLERLDRLKSALGTIPLEYLSDDAVGRYMEYLPDWEYDKTTPHIPGKSRRFSRLFPEQTLDLKIPKLQPETPHREIIQDQHVLTVTLDQMSCDGLCCIIDLDRQLSLLSKPAPEPKDL